MNIRANGLFLLLCCWTINAFAAQDAGTDSALYLGTGSRNLAMGRTGVTDFESPTCIDWNPGAAGFAPYLAASLQHAALFGNTLHDSIGLIYPSLDLGSLAITFNRMQVGDIERRDLQNLPQGSFSLVEQAVNLGYGYALWDFLALGFTVKAHNLSLAEYQSTAPGVDAGVLCKWPLTNEFIKSVSLGAACRNAYSPRLKLREETDQLFPTFRAGVEGTFSLIHQWSDQLLIRFDAEKPERSDLRLHGGMEYSLNRLVALRGGWDDSYFSAGAGIAYAGLRLDYAVSFPDLGLRHLVTLSAAMGDDMAAVKARRVEDEQKKRQAIVDNLKAKIVEDYKQQAQKSTQAQNYAEAAKFWGKILDWDPSNTEAKTQLETIQKIVVEQQNTKSLTSAKECMQKQNYVDAMVECQQILERDPQNVAAKTIYAEAEQKAKQLGSFSLTTNIKVMESIREEYQLGLRAYTQRRYPEAVEHWEKVIENTPLQKQVYRFLQNARKRIQQEQQAQIEQPKNLSAPTEDERKRTEMYKEAVELSKSGKLKEAVRSWENMIKENPADKDAKENFEKTRQDLINSQKKGIKW